MKPGIIGQLTHDERVSIDSEFCQIKFDKHTSDGFEPFLNSDFDKAEAYTHGVKRTHLRAILKYNEYCKFANEFSGAGRDIFTKRYRKKIVDDFFFEGFYAARHTDKHIPAKHQIMFVLGNIGQHRLYSKDFGMIIPQRGDIIYINTHKDHAVFPAAGLSAKKCAARPFEFYAVTWGNS